MDNLENSPDVNLIAPEEPNYTGPGAGTAAPKPPAGGNASSNFAASNAAGGSFAGISPSGASTSAFDGIPPEATPEVGKPPSGPSSAQTAALATLDPTSPSPIDDFRTATASFEQASQAYGETAIRYGVATQQRAEAVSRAVGMISQTSGVNPALEEQNKAMSAFAEQELNKSIQQREAYAQEQKAVEHIQELAGHGDTVQAKVLLDNMIHGGPIDVQRDINTKQMLIRREIDKAQVPYQQQGWVSDLIDFAAGAIPRIPGVTDTDVWSFNDDNVVKHWYDGLLSGNRQLNQIGSLWSLPVDQFQKALEKSVVPAIMKNSTFMGLTNHSDVLDMLTRLQATPPAIQQNVNDVIDNLGWIPYSKVGKLASLPAYMVGLGARKETADLLAKAAADIITNGADGAKATTGLTEKEVTSALSPSALNIEDMDLDDLSHFNARMEDIYTGQTKVPSGESVPQTVPDTSVPKRAVPIAVQATNALETAEKLLATTGLTGSGRLSADELKVAEDAYTQSISEEINGKWVKNGKPEGSSPITDVQFNSLRLANGSIIRQPIITMGGFATKKEAFEFASSLGYTDAKIWAEEKSFTTSPFKLADEHAAELAQIEGSAFRSAMTPRGGTFVEGRGRGLVVAARMPDGSIRYGKPGDLHTDLPFELKDLENGTLKDENFGFAQPGGKFMSRKEAAQWIKKNDKATAQFLPNLAGKRAEPLEASEYQKAQANAAKVAPAPVPTATEPHGPIGQGFPQERSDFIHDHPVIQDASGQYMVQITRNLPENGFYTNVLNPQANTSIARYVLNARLLGDKALADQAQLAGNNASHFLKNVIKPYTETINRLGKEQRWFLGQVLAKGESATKWWSKEEFSALYDRALGRLPTENEWGAYSQYRNLNDIEHALRNDAEYMPRATRGMETVSFDTGLGKVSRENAMVQRVPQGKPIGRSFVVGLGEHFSNRRVLSGEQFNLLADQGYHLIETERPIELSDGTMVKYFHVKPQDAKIEVLRRDQVNYLEGGHRMYEGKYMVKQAVYGSQKDTGQRFLDSAKTHVIMKNMAEAKAWSNRMEAARLLYNGALEKGGKDFSAIDQVFGGHAGFPSTQEFVDGMEKGVYQKDTEFTPLYDRELPQDYYKLNTNVVDYSNRDETGISSWLRSQGRMYYGQKGPQAKDYHGALAPTLDPYETLNASLMNIAKLSSFSDFKQASVQRWVESFQAYTDYDKLAQGASHWQIFENAEVSPQTWRNNPRLANGIQAQKDIIKNILGWKTPSDFAKDHYTRSLADWVIGDNPDSKLRAFLAKPIEWWNTKSPLDAMRGWAFDIHLGLFNPASFALHASTAAAIVAMGKNSFRTMLALPFMRIYLSHSGGEDFLNELVNKGIAANTGFASDAEFKTFMRYSKNSGFLDLNNSHQLINSYGPRAALSDYGNAFDKVKQAGRFFFNEGVLMTRMAAQKIAWQEIRERLPALAVDSPEFKAAVAGRAEEYSLSMSRESSSYWQSGLLSVPTQFWAYPARIFEAMFGNTFTGATRWRLIASQLLLGGAAALPFTSTLMAFYQNSTGAGKEQVPPDSITGMVDRGLLDTILYKMTGADVTVGHRFTAGKDADEIVGGMIPSQVKSLFGFSGYGSKSFAEVLGGVGGLFAGQLGQTAYSILRYSVQESGGTTERPVTSDDITNLALNIGAVNNAFKAYMIGKYGQMVNKKGDVTYADLPTAAAWETMLLGGTPGNQDHVARMMDWLGNEKQAVKDAAAVFQGLREKAFTQPDRADDFVNQANWYAQMLPPNIRAKALHLANENISPSLEQSLQRQIDREKAQQQMQLDMQQEKK